MTEEASRKAYTKSQNEVKKPLSNDNCSEGIFRSNLADLAQDFDADLYSLLKSIAHGAESRNLPSVIENKIYSDCLLCRIYEDHFSMSVNS